MFKGKISKREKVWLGFFCLILLFTSLSLYTVKKKEKKEPDHPKSDRWIYGITIDDSWYENVDIKQVVNAIKDMPVKPTVRIVMSEEILPKDYRELFMEIKEVAYIMASPVDSYYMNSYPDKKSYLKRFQESYAALSEFVDIWEIGNEINGVEWIKQSPELIIDKVSEVNEFIRSKNGKTAITLYYTNPDQNDMFAWISEYFPDDLTWKVDYALISYYEDDNEGYIPEWQLVFSKLEKVFPSANLGIGECGNTLEQATVSSKVAMAHSYYTMESFSDNFVGGYFWWNWVQDCVPHQENQVYEEINRCMKQQTGNL